MSVFREGALARDGDMEGEGRVMQQHLFPYCVAAKDSDTVGEDHETKGWAGPGLREQVRGQNKENSDHALGTEIPVAMWAEVPSQGVCK